MICDEYPVLKYGVEIKGHSRKTCTQFQSTLVETIMCDNLSDNAIDYFRVVSNDSPKDLVYSDFIKFCKSHNHDLILSATMQLRTTENASGKQC